jgi:hypothetical protein
VSDGGERAEDLPGDEVETPEMLPLYDLCCRFQAEVERYRSRLGCDDRYAYELLRRAIVERDGASWEVLVDGYHYQVVAWCRRADVRDAFEPEELVALTWEKFWRSFSARKFAAASGVAAILRYLQMCAATASADLARAEQRTVPLDNVPPEVCGYSVAEEGRALETTSRAALWQIVRAALKSDHEVAIVELLFQRGLKPAAVQLRRPDLFSSVDAVYTVTRNLLDRLRRNHELRAWLECEELVYRAKAPRSRRR